MLLNKLTYKKCIYFFDLEIIGYYQTGFQFIEKYKLQNDSILVTNHFDKKDVCENCEKLQIKIIPKDLYSRA